MQPVKAILFEPVGCLAEFPADPFNEIAAHFFQARPDAARSGSRAYWHLLSLMDAAGRIPCEAEALEVEAVHAAAIYEDVFPALSELKQMNVQLFLTSSLSQPAVQAFLEKGSVRGLFSGIWSRDSASGIKEAPLRAAAAPPGNTIFLTDTAEGIRVARNAGVSPVLMMNDPDEAKRLATQNPAGGIVSLLELPDFVRIVAARNRNSQ